MSGQFIGGPGSAVYSKWTVVRARVFLMAYLIFLPAGAAFSQVLTIGPDFSGFPSAGGDSNSEQVRTVIDLFAPASATGIVTSVHFYWSTAGCSNALKIKFFRPSTKLTMVAERGPFTVSATDVTMPLSPPVPVLKGDVIGITRLTNCGTPMLFHEQNATYAYFSSDFRGPYSAGYNYIFGERLALAGTGIETEDVLRAVIPVVGSAAGANGSNFRTSLQLLCGAGVTNGAITGKLVFHPAGTSGTASDPTVTYTVGAGQILSFPDIGTTFGRSGTGSIDLLTTQTALRPIIITRVFNDAGSAGTAGLTEDLIDLSDVRVLNAATTGFLVTPVDPAKTRFNIGVRTLLLGASLTAVLRDANGAAVRSVTKSYPPNWFEQVDSTNFFSGFAISANQSIAITISSGSVIVYGSTTDNTTNDPNIQYASPMVTGS
ncbi:MAG: hypothetical protein DMF56_19330 [Acidobacteria bacterium]|nr:MAG: hypothetical protein DMF56_19330 [Acidobacteriota bacterium]